jgi:hypothetical protein
MPFGFLAPNNFIWLSNILSLSVPDEGYSRNASCTLNLKYMRLLLQDVVNHMRFLKTSKDLLEYMLLH